MAVRFTALQFLIYLLSHLLSSLAEQAILMEEPFSSKIVVVANVFCMRYVAMIVTQHTQVVMRGISLRTYL